MPLVPKWCKQIRYAYISRTMVEIHFHYSRIWRKAIYLQHQAYKKCPNVNTTNTIHTFTTEYHRAQGCINAVRIHTIINKWLIGKVHTPLTIIQYSKLLEAIDHTDDFPIPALQTSTIINKTCNIGLILHVMLSQ